MVIFSLLLFKAIKSKYVVRSSIDEFGGINKKNICFQYQKSRANNACHLFPNYFCLNLLTFAYLDKYIFSKTKNKKQNNIAHACKRGQKQQKL